MLLKNTVKESTASDKAHKLGLKHAGFGRWKDKEGKVVAKTQDDKLVKISDKESKSKDKAPEKNIDNDEIYDTIGPAYEDAMSVDVKPITSFESAHGKKQRKIFQKMHFEMKKSVNKAKQFIPSPSDPTQDMWNNTNNAYVELKELEDKTTKSLRKASKPDDGIDDKTIEEIKKIYEKWGIDYTPKHIEDIKTGGDLTFGSPGWPAAKRVVGEIIDEMVRTGSWVRESAFEIQDHLQTMNGRITEKTKKALTLIENQASQTEIGELINEYTGDGYELSFRPGKLCAYAIALQKGENEITEKDVDEEYRLTKMKKDCRTYRRTALRYTYMRGTEVWNLCAELIKNGKIELKSDEINNLHQLSKITQRALVETGLVDSKGYIQLYRGIQDEPISSRGQRFKTSPGGFKIKEIGYKGNAFDSWSLSPFTAASFGRYIATSRVHISKALWSPAIAQTNGLSQQGPNEGEVIIDSRELDQCELSDLVSQDFSKVKDDRPIEMTAIEAYPIGKRIRGNTPIDLLAAQSLF